MTQAIILKVILNIHKKYTIFTRTIQWRLKYCQ